MSIKSPWNLGRFLLLQCLAIGLTGLTMFLGAAPLRLVRKFYSPAAYWVTGAACSAGMFVAGLQEFAFGFGSLVCMVGLYSFFEGRQWSFKAAATAAVLISSSILYSSIVIWSQANNIDWTQRIEQELAKVSDVEVELPMDTIIAQMPSIIVVLMMVAMAFSLVWEPRLRSLVSGVPEDTVSERLSRFTDFRVPEPLIFALIPSLLFSTVYFDIQILQNVALNVLNVMVILYMFQGLAVVHRFFWVMKMGPFWRILFYFILLVQLQSILLVAILGVADYWMDFRKKIDTRLINKDGSSQ